MDCKRGDGNESDVLTALPEQREQNCDGHKHTTGVQPIYFT